MKYLATALLTVFVVYGVWWLTFEMEPAELAHDCIKSHTYFVPVVIGKTTQMQPRRHCDEYGPWYPNPRHARWCASHSDRCRE